MKGEQKRKERRKTPRGNGKKLEKLKRFERDPFSAILFLFKKSFKRSLKRSFKPSKETILKTFFTYTQKNQIKMNKIQANEKEKTVSSKKAKPKYCLFGNRKPPKNRSGPRGFLFPSSVNLSSLLPHPLRLLTVSV